ncbi:hypothetical protein CEXT_752391 [Caerostris extrusa]|uniref:CCHC FOG-type domain-containing protein n=1 Tax=Caerostris extrusa TaxID=172846 RepID=A0AAV4SCP2_CAEEX|nr:hypothetical protein CEXT_752391 [Caerostris extrusa]
MSLFFKCLYCNYWSYMKRNLIRHISGVHGDSHVADGIEDLLLTTPHLDRYCAKCDIHFALHDNYQVHKEHYCNTRPVREYSEYSSSPTPPQQLQQLQNQEYHPIALPNQPRSPGSSTTIEVTSESESESRDFINSSSPTLTQQLQQPQNQEHHPIALPNQSRSPGSNNTIVVTSESESESESRDFINSSPISVTSESESGFNMGLNQPLYTAIATSALTLVPCSYAADGGLSSGTGVTTPAGNMIIQNPSTTPKSNSDSQGGIVIPTYTVMPETEVAELNHVPSPVSGDEGVKEVSQPMRTCKEKVSKHIPSKSPKEQSEEEAEKPLDLSFKKR